MTFINDGNPNCVDKLVNFEKMVWLKCSFQHCLAWFLFSKLFSHREVNFFLMFFLSSIISCSAWLLKQSKLFEDAEASLTVCLPVKLVLLTKISLQFWKKTRYDTNRYKHGICDEFKGHFFSTAPSSPQRGLADRMFLEGPAMRISTCKLQLPLHLI